MIYPVKDGFVISSHQVWMPGLYDTEQTARYAFRFDDETLRRLQDEKGQAAITMEDLKKQREKEYEPLA